MSDEGTRAGKSAASAPHDHTGRLIAAPMSMAADDDETAIAWAKAYVTGLDNEVMDREWLVYSKRLPESDSASRSDA